MTKNEGTIDRAIRLVLTIVLATISYFWLTGYWQISGYVLSVIVLITVVTGFCGLYKLFGINTAKKDEKSEESIVEPKVDSPVSDPMKEVADEPVEKSELAESNIEIEKNDKR